MSRRRRQWPRFCALLAQLIADSSIYDWKPSADDQRFILAILDTLATLGEHAQGADSAFWRQLLKSIKAQAQFHFQINLQNMKLPDDFNARDIPMADNLIWLAREVFPGRKLIVWAQSGHLTRNSSLILPEFPGLVTMGHAAWQALGSRIYSIAFTSYDGADGAIGAKPTALRAPPTGSLEDLWAATSQNVAFLDLRRLATGGEWLNEPLWSSPFRSFQDDEGTTAVWPLIFDAMIFIRTMQPSTRTG